MTEMRQFRCPACAKKLGVQSKSGMILNVRCPECDHEFHYQEAVVETTDENASPGLTPHTVSKARPSQSAALQQQVTGWSILVGCCLAVFLAGILVPKDSNLGGFGFNLVTAAVLGVFLLFMFGFLLLGVRWGRALIGTLLLAGASSIAADYVVVRIKDDRGTADGQADGEIPSGASVQPDDTSEGSMSNMTSTPEDERAEVHPKIPAAADIGNYVFVECRGSATSSGRELGVTLTDVQSSFVFKFRFSRNSFDLFTQPGGWAPFCTPSTADVVATCLIDETELYGKWSKSEEFETEETNVTINRQSGAFDLMRRTEKSDYVGNTISSSTAGKGNCEVINNPLP